MRRRRQRGPQIVPLPMDRLRVTRSRDEYLDAVHAWADLHEPGSDVAAEIRVLANELRAFEVPGGECHERVVGLARALGATT